ncbi:MAG: hypothetical protein AAF438_16455, partial [Pseudomonadota bacterium]
RYFIKRIFLFISIYLVLAVTHVAATVCKLYKDTNIQKILKKYRHRQSATVTQSRTVPDLGVANLVEVATRDLNGSHITHYAGVNGCRLTYFRGKFSPGEQSPSFQVQVAEWSTSNNVRHMIMATGMDQNKFNAIATFLELTTRQQESEEVLASLTEATASAVRCVS